MSKEFLYLAYDVIGKLVFSKDFNLLDGYNHDILIWIRSLLIFVVLNAVLPPIRLIGNPYYRKLAYMAKDAILQRRQMIENGEEAPTDLLNSLVHAKDPVTDEHIPMLDLMEECAELLLGGSDTTGNSLTWCLYLILKNSEAKIKMENEITAQFPDKTKTIKYKEIQKNLPYFQLVLKECMRYYPVASHPMLRSVPKEGVTIKDIYIPGNYEVITNCYAIHHNENYWKDPEKFDPERFNNPKENDLSAYLPFSSGPRGCVGRNLANLEMMLTLVNLFHKFNITLVNKEDLTPACHIVLHPKGHQPFWVSFTEK
ncbi:cytochrome P450 [Neoconidiobolus thromboides FSU 785]|nr:cytochrome P450 [Neoconidiobolus thromboides FSU 785]